MRFLAFFSTLLLYGCAAIAQSNFEGSITYKITPGNDARPETCLHVYLKGSKMLLKSNGIREKPVYAVYDFEKAERYDLFVADSTAVKYKLTANPFAEQKKDLAERDDLFNIDGYTAEKVSFSIPAPAQKNIRSIDAWFSKKIIYRVPASSSLILPPLILFNDSSISLKMRVIMSETPGSSPLSTASFVEAISVSTKPVSDSIFNLPPFFKILTQKEYLDSLLKRFNEVDAGLQNAKPVENEE